MERDVSFILLRQPLSLSVIHTEHFTTNFSDVVYNIVRCVRILCYFYSILLIVVQILFEIL